MSAFPCSFCGNAKMKDQIERLTRVNADLLAALEEARVFLRYDGSSYRPSPLRTIDAAIDGAKDLR